MSQPKKTMSDKKAIVHYTVGAVIQKDGKYLLIDRAVPPYGFAGIAGHVDDGETANQALVREVKEESGLTVVTHHLLFEERLDWNWCSRGVTGHHWYVYACDVRGTIQKNVRETKSIGWYVPEEMKHLTFEPAWRYWFEKMGVV